MTAQRRGRELSNRLLLWAAIASLAIGVAPIVANILSSEVTSWLGCYFTEFTIRSRSGTPNDFSDDVFGCPLGPVDVGWLLVIALFVSLFTFSLKWPFLLLSLFLWTGILVRRLIRPPV